MGLLHCLFSGPMTGCFFRRLIGYPHRIPGQRHPFEQSILLILGSAEEHLKRVVEIIGTVQIIMRKIRNREIEIVFFRILSV